MNDFTKEELEEILLGIRHFYVAHYKGLIANKNINVSSGTEIIAKLQSMIDNYKEPSCNHEWVLIHTNPNIHDYRDFTYYKCINCGGKKE